MTAAPHFFVSVASKGLSLSFALTRVDDSQTWLTGSFGSRAPSPVFVSVAAKGLMQTAAPWKLLTCATPGALYWPGFFSTGRSLAGGGVGVAEGAVPPVAGFAAEMPPSV
jgi:hypothetical protein